MRFDVLMIKEMASEPVLAKPGILIRKSVEPEWFYAKHFGFAKWEAVNEEVERVTQMGIKIVPQAPTDTCVINCLHFKDQWKKQFDATTHPMRFQTSKDTTAVVDMMKLRMHTRFVKQGSMIAVCLPYLTPGMQAWFVKSTVKGGETLDADKAVIEFLKQRHGKKRLCDQQQEIELRV
jgi:hypothetical protein